MKKYCKGLASLILIALLIVSTLQKAHAQDVVASYQTFYDELSPYGQWVGDPQYGNVWVPNEAPGYRPYATGGHWAMTEYGNMWVSDAPYGWACYHYGRWTYNPYYGWVWIPGHEWAPAWVSWRSGEGYYGWAPMGPGYEPGGVYEYPANYWVFVGPEHLYHHDVYTYYEPNRSEYYMRRTTYINETYRDNGTHTTYYYGPRRETIERETHQPVQVYRVSEARSAGPSSVRGNEVQVYRPAVSRESEHMARPANVMQASHPVGRPQEISRGAENRQPEFRQEVQRQSPARNTGAAEQRSQPPVRNEQPMNREEHPAMGRQQQFQQNQQPGNRPEQPANSRYQPQQNQQPANRGEQQSNRYQPQQNQQPMNRQQPQQNQQPSRAQPQPHAQPHTQQKPQPQEHEKK